MSAEARPTTRSAPHAGGFAAAAAISGPLIAYLTLPILPVAAYSKTSLPASYPETANQVGWPQFVAIVDEVVATLPPAQRAHAVILTNDYSEASPLVLLGVGLPPVFPGHNDVAHIDNRHGIHNSEQGKAVSVCTGTRAPWSTIWPALRTIS